jgi:hypothetical protein
VGRDIAQVRAEELIRPRGGLTLGYYATPLFVDAEFPPSWGLAQRLAARIFSIHISDFAVRHSVQVSRKSRRHVVARQGRGERGQVALT